MQPSHEIRLKHLTCNSSPPSSHQHKSSTESHLPVLEEFVDKDIINHLLLIFWRLSMGSLLLINEFHVSVHAHSVVCDSLQPHGLQPRHASLSMGFPRQEYWRIPWTEEPDGLKSMGSQRVRHELATNVSL